MSDVLSVRLFELMKERNFSQKELAMRAGITESAVSRYVKGIRVPTSEILANMATVLGTTSNYLLGKEDEWSSFSNIKALLSKNAKKLTEEEKEELFKIISKGE